MSSVWYTPLLTLHRFVRTADDLRGGKVTTGTDFGPARDCSGFRRLAAPGGGTRGSLFTSGRPDHT
jgi:hypothetical protein